MSASDINQIMGQISRLQAQVGMAGVSPAATPAAATEGVNFSTLLQNSIEGVSKTQQHAVGMTKAYESGESQVDLAEVMVSLQKANVSFTAMTEVRNKLVEAYQDIMNMPV